MDHCCPDICNCFCLQHLKEIMIEYNNCMNVSGKEYVTIYSLNIHHILDHFLHLINKHENEKEFEFISSQMGYCNIATCKIFTRNNRITVFSENKDNHNYLCAVYEILDKIHCYYQHCYDIANKLYMNDQRRVNAVDITEIDYDNHLNKYLINKQIIKMNQILSARRGIYRNMDHILTTRINKKYNQLSQTSANEQKYDINTSNDKIYSFGYKFEYGYKGEGYAHSSIRVKPKYHSLKEELTSNEICSLSMDQFVVEYHKAEMHYTSNYCNQHFVPYSDNDGVWIFSVEHILSLMIYCNFTTLQYKFSKTYRENKGLDHNNYYHLGKSLKIAIKKFGTKTEDGNVKWFYHGISQKMIFPQYINYIHIHCPLSTSSSFVVASNFTNCNNGLIVQFGDNGWSDTKYFSVSWLSDYGNESEYLFIQNNNEYTETLEIENIYDCTFGLEFDIILKALKIIDDITNNELNGNPSKRMKSLIHKIISKQLISLNEYAKKLINVYCQNKMQIILDYTKLNDENYAFLLQMFCNLDYQWIKIKDINLLFPNIQQICVCNVDLYINIMDNIYNYLSDVYHKKIASKLRVIDIKISKKTAKLTPTEAIKKYKTKFKIIKFNLLTNDKKDILYFESM